MSQTAEEQILPMAMGLARVLKLDALQTASKCREVKSAYQVEH